MMPSRYARKSEVISPRKIFICCEDEKTEVNYYRQFLQEYSITEAEVEIIWKPPSFSKPADVLRAVESKIEQLRKDNRLIGIEEFWLAMDVDWWGHLLAEVVRECSAYPNYNPVISYPCFEVWLLSHHYSVEEISKKQGELAGKKEINALLATKNLSGKLSADYIPYTGNAIATSRRLDLVPEDGIPQTIGTRVHRLIEAILSMKKR